MPSKRFVIGQEYLDFNEDLKKVSVDPLQHFLTYVSPVGELREIRTITIDLPSFLPSDWNWQKYISAYKDLQDAKIDTQEKAEWHYLTYGYYENRWPLPNPQYPVGKLSVLRQWNDHKEAFCCMLTPEGDLVARYGLHNGGADVCLNGTIEEHFPRNESAFKLFKPTNGDIICIFEHYGDIRQRVNGKWVDRSSTGRLQDLCLDIKETADGILWVIISGFDNRHSMMYRSLDKGVTWSKYRDYPGTDLNTLIVDGNEVTIAGGIGNNVDEVLLDINGNVLYTNPNGNGFTLWGAYKKNGKWALGTWNCSGILEGYINCWDGHNCFQRLPNDVVTSIPQPFVHDMVEFRGCIYAIATNDWEAKEGVTQLFKTKDCFIWEKVMDMPYPHIIKIDTYEKGLLFCGGCHDVSGIVLIYPFEV